MDHHGGKSCVCGKDSGTLGGVGVFDARRRGDEAGTERLGLAARLRQLALPSTCRASFFMFIYIPQARVVHVRRYMSLQDKLTTADETTAVDQDGAGSDQDGPDENGTTPETTMTRKNKARKRKKKKKGAAAAIGQRDPPSVLVSTLFPNSTYPVGEQLA
ncbi:hypothetical protein KC349_g3218 [Hortaea werneckii]|nr:hypothetical protein KC349_g3218 [Hortaea werneckii]